MTKQAKTKPKCVRGTPCGYSCISAKRQCSDRILKRDADALLAGVQPKAKASELPLPYKGEHPTHRQEETFDVPPDKITVNMVESYYGNIAGAVEISIFVNYSTDSTDSGVADPKQALKVAMGAMRKTKEMVAKMPDGTLLSNSPTNVDGRGDARASLYEKAGFSPVGKDSMMHAVVVNGKITPAGPEYLKANYGYDS